MPNFHSGHFRIFWDILFEAADRYDRIYKTKKSFSSLHGFQMLQQHILVGRILV